MRKKKNLKTVNTSREFKSKTIDTSSKKPLGSTIDASSKSFRGLRARKASEIELRKTDTGLRKFKEKTKSAKKQSEDLKTTKSATSKNFLNAKSASSAIQDRKVREILKKKRQ